VADVQLWRRLLAELLGSAFLAAVVIGSGIAAQRLSPGETGLELLENAAATAAGLFAIILMFGPVSGGHFNPVVSFADAVFGGLSWRDAAAYLSVSPYLQPEKYDSYGAGPILGWLITGDLLDQHLRHRSAQSFNPPVCGRHPKMGQMPGEIWFRPTVPSNAPPPAKAALVRKRRRLERSCMSECCSTST
jgi:hypothetical protein